MKKTPLDITIDSSTSILDDALNERCGRDGPRPVLLLLERRELARKALGLWLRRAQRSFAVVEDSPERLTCPSVIGPPVHLIVVSIGCGVTDLETLNQKIQACFRDVPTLLLMEANSVDLAAEALHAGFRGAISMSMDERVVLAALRLVGVGGTSFPSELFRPGLAPSSSIAPIETSSAAVSLPETEALSDPRLALLTRREKEVVARLTVGDCNKRIARALNISEHTVKVHIRHILAKLELANRTQIAVLGQARGSAMPSTIA